MLCLFPYGVGFFDFLLVDQRRCRCGGNALNHEIKRATPHDMALINARLLPG
ncbi:hypothetical protein SAMN05444172_6014 [Burkholderia sp. GAS332]|jgi:hypothetical protein|nr:hypothetical protein SAMN05444172_6014 [Burkholderia sp. GAS332]